MAVAADGDIASTGIALRVNGDSVACGGCQISLDLVTTLGDSSDPVGPQIVTGDIARDSRGRFYTWSYDRTELLVYGETGDLIERFGRQGQGPGEISARGTRLIMSTGDSLFAFVGSRYLVFSPSRKVVRTVQLPSSPFGTPVALSNGTVVMSAPFDTPDTRGYGVHVVSANGRVVKSFGGDGSFDVRCSQCLNHRVAAAESGMVWIVPPNRYEMLAVDLVGVVRRSLRIHGGWFVASSDPLRPYVPITSIRQDREGRLWVFAIIRPAVTRTGRGVSALTDSARQRIVDQVRTRVDVFDPFAGALLARHTLEGGYLAFGDGYVTKTRELPGGFVVLDIFTVRFANPST